VSNWLEKVSEFVIRTKWENLDEQTKKQVIRIFIDTIGVIVGGLSHKSFNFKTLPFLRGGASACGINGKVDELKAAFVNGSLSVAMELDEGNQFATGHPAVHCLPATLAMGEYLQIPAKDVLESFYVGYEVSTRYARSIVLKQIIHPHGTWGVVGSAVACSKLLKFDLNTFQKTLLFAPIFSHPVPQSSVIEGSNIRDIMVGLANLSGILVTKSIEAGYDPPVRSSEFVFGNVLGESFNPIYFDDFYTNNYVLKNYFKIFPTSRWTHAPIEAALDIFKKYKLNPNTIEKIIIETYSPATRLSIPFPKNKYAARFSIPFCVATALIYGEFNENQLEKIDDPAIFELQRKIQVIENKEMSSKVPFLRPAKITVITKDGIFSSIIKNPKGGFDNPLSENELEQKFLNLVKPHVDNPSEFLRTLKSIENLNDLEEIGQFLRKAKF